MATIIEIKHVRNKTKQDEQYRPIVVYINVWSNSFNCNL